MNKVEFTIEQIEEAIQDMEGFCTNCEDIVDVRCEPDAQGYLCPYCNSNTVMGVENALMMGWF